MTMLMFGISDRGIPDGHYGSFPLPVGTTATKVNGGFNRESV